MQLHPDKVDLAVVDQELVHLRIRIHQRIAASSHHCEHSFEAIFVLAKTHPQHY